MKIKHTFLSLLIVFSFSYGYGQNVDYDQIIPPTYPSDLLFQEKLVYLAWKNHPSNTALAHLYNISKKNKVKANWAWLDIFTAAYNINEFTINPTEETKDRAIFYPKYNFGASLNLAKFIEVPTDIKIAKEEVGIAKANLNQQKIELRAEVLIAYQNYLLAKEILDMQIVTTEESFSRFSLNEQRFKNGEITLEEYNTTLANYNAERKNKLIAETNFNIRKIALEEFIGVPLESVK